MSAITSLPKNLHRSTVVIRRLQSRQPQWSRNAAHERSVPVPDIARNIHVKFASTRQEWEDAFQLVTDNYQARGFEPAGSSLRFTSYHALPDTVVLVAKEADRVVATFTLIPDQKLLGLPLEGVYREEIQQLRRRGLRLFETGNLAERGLSTREFMHVFLALMQLGWQRMTRNGIATTVIAVHPRHNSFYTKLHGFVPLGSQRAYDKVHGAPAQLLYVDPDLMRSRVPQTYQRLFGQRLSAAVLNAPRMSPDLVRYFANRSSQTDVRAIEQILWLLDNSDGPRNCGIEAAIKPGLV